MMQKKNHFSKKTPFFFLIFAGLFGFSLCPVDCVAVGKWWLAGWLAQKCFIFADTKFTML